MSRTLAGNLTGKAARDEMADLRERMRHDEEQREKAKRLTHEQTMDVCQELADIMGDEYLEWVTKTPAKGFSEYAATKLVALKSLAFEVEQEIQRDNDWLGELHNTRDIVRVIPNRVESVRYDPRSEQQKEDDNAALDWQNQISELRGGGW